MQVNHNKTKEVPIHTTSEKMVNKYEKDAEKVRAKFYAMRLKIFLTTLIFLCFLTIFIKILPTGPLIPASYPSNPLQNPSLNEVIEDEVVLKRSFNPVGTAAYNFILMSAYRVGSNTFAIMGLASKPLHVFGQPIYKCTYKSKNIGSLVDTAEGQMIKPDYGLGHVYATVVVTCSFPIESKVVNNSVAGGELMFHASVNGGFDTRVKTTDTILAVTERPNSWSASQFTLTWPKKYDYLYCGSPLFGDISPQRVREWLAYHVRLFGERSHFIIYDAGGVHPEVLEVLMPWIELGFVTLHDIREQERFDAFYHNQVIVLNDCLHRYRFEAKWIFFFDVDEFIYTINGIDSFGSVMDSFEEFSQITIEQTPMSDQLCLYDDASKINQKWGFEKLVYKNVKENMLGNNRKFALQPGYTSAVEVHMSSSIKGNSKHDTGQLIKFVHYHNTIALRREPCRRFTNDALAKVDHALYAQELCMTTFAPMVKSFEFSKIGNKLEFTRQ